MGCLNSVTVHAPADTVWAALRDFHDMSKCPNVVQSCEAVGDGAGTQIGAKRLLNGVFHETLIGLDDKARMLRYTIDDGPDVLSKGQVVGYVGQVQVFPITENNTSLVLWTSSWEAGRDGIQAFCDPIYQALLADLKASFV